jgi:hypothetical protein
MWREGCIATRLKARAATESLCARRTECDLSAPLEKSHWEAEKVRSGKKKSEAERRAQ